MKKAGQYRHLNAARLSREWLGGKVEMRPETHRGTCLTLTVPLLIAALDGLQIEGGGIAATIPIEAVQRTLRADIARTAQGKSIIFEGRAIPFLPRGSRVWSAARRQSGWIICSATPAW